MTPQKWLVVGNLCLALLAIVLALLSVGLNVYASYLWRQAARYKAIAALHSRNLVPPPECRGSDGQTP